MAQLLVFLLLVLLPLDAPDPGWAPGCAPWCILLCGRFLALGSLDDDEVGKVVNGRFLALGSLEDDNVGRPREEGSEVEEPRGGKLRKSSLETRRFLV